MHYTLAYLYRRDDINRERFREHYEQHHTHLARRTLPEFSHYRRNHVIDTTDPAQCPDVFSEFGYDSDADLQQVMAILRDGRGQPLLDDELTFMNKPRNRVFPIAREGDASAEAPHKYIVVVRGGGVAATVWLAALKEVDTGLAQTAICSELGVDSELQTHWLMGWSAQQPDLPALEQRLRGLAVPLEWSATVLECRGYPI